MPEIPLEHVHIAPEEATTGDPAVFVLHGRGADEADLLPVARELPDDLNVISLRAPERLQGGYTWYELDLSDGGLHQSQPDPTDFRRSLEAVSTSVDAAVEEYDLDPNELGLLGFSQGAITSLGLLLETPNRYAWTVALHGYLADIHSDLAPDGIENKPVFVAAGTGDRVIPIDRAEAAAGRLREIGADVTYNAYETGHGIGPAELSDVVAFVESRLS